MTVYFNQNVRAAILNLYGSATAGAVSYPYTYAVPQLLIFACATPPASADVSLSSGAASTLLAQVPFNASTPAFGTPTVAIPSVITANAMQTYNAVTSGTASYYRTYAATAAAAAITGAGIYTTGQVIMISTLGSGNWAAMGCGGTPATGMCFVTNGTIGSGAGSPTAFLMGVATGAGCCVEQGSCGQGSGDLNLNSTSIIAAGPVSITSFTRQM